MLKNSNLLYWTTEELDDLYDNYQYYRKNKEEAVNVFKRTWSAIEAKAIRSGYGKREFNKSNKNITTTLKDYFYGLICSDGHVKLNKATACYQQGCKDIEWLNLIKDELYINNIESTIDKGYEHKGTINNISFSGFSYTLYSNYYKDFVELRNKWYINNTKIIPNDLNINPIFLCNEYLGDGNIFKSPRSANSYQITLATCSFTKKDSSLLSTELNKVLNIKSYTNKSNNIIIGRLNDIKYFLNYIWWNNKIPNCYNYKFPIELISVY